MIYNNKLDKYRASNKTIEYKSMDLTAGYSSVTMDIFEYLDTRRFSWTLFTLVCR